jgi:hypothetical protein
MGFSRKDLEAIQARMGRSTDPPKPQRRKTGDGDFAKRKAWECRMLQGPGTFLNTRTYSDANGRGSHWNRTDRIKRHRELGAMIIAKMLRPDDRKLPATITFTRYSPGILDDDNLRSAFKAIRDGIADAFKVNDRDSRYTWVYKQEKSPHYGIRIEVQQ